VNLAYAGSITPLLYSAQVESGVQLACMVYMGPLLDDPGAAIIQPESITWDGDGTFSANWRGYTWRISPLPM